MVLPAGNHFAYATALTQITVINQFIPDPERYQGSYSHSSGQPDDVDCRIDLAFQQIPPDDDEIIF